METLQAKKRNYMIDFIKAVCIIFVIMNHSGVFDKESSVVFLLLVDKAVPAFMMLSGYTLAMSLWKSEPKKAYMPSEMLRKFFRFTIPALIAYSLFLIYSIFTVDNISIKWIIKTFVAAKYGQGAYYYDLMIEFLFIAPILLYIVKRMRIYGVMLVALCNFIYELSCLFVHVSGGVYRILIFRYITMIACGMYIYYLIKIAKKNIKIYILFTMMILGSVYILAPKFGYTYKIFTYKPWGRTSMITALYVFPIIYSLIMHSEKNIFSGSKFSNFICLIGKSSYHIMYTQMIYYLVRPYIDSHLFNIGFLGIWVELIINIVVAVISGIAFYYVDNFLFGRLYKRKKKANDIVLKEST